MSVDHDSIVMIGLSLKSLSVSLCETRENEGYEDEQFIKDGVGFDIKYESSYSDNAINDIYIGFLLDDLDMISYNRASFLKVFGKEAKIIHSVHYS